MNINTESNLLPPIKSTISVNVVDGNVVVYLTFENTSSDGVLLDQISACLDGHIRNNIFDISVNDVKINYIGRMVKRKAGPFINLNPGEKISTQVVLNGSYEFLPGMSSYKIRYSVFNPFDGIENMYDLNSNYMSFEYSK